MNKTDQEMYQRVVAVLDDWRAWAKDAAYSRLLTPLQFLAVVVWVLQARKGDELTEEETRLAVAHWGLVLDRGIEDKTLRPLHGVTLLPVPEASASDWVLSAGQLIGHMERLPWAFDLHWALDEFLKCSGAQAVELSTWEEAADLHRSESADGKKAKWTHTKLKPISAAVLNGVRLADIAKKAGISRAALDEALKKYRVDPERYGKPTTTHIQTTPTMGGLLLADAWQKKTA